MPVEPDAWAIHAHRALREGGHRLGAGRERVIDELAARGGGRTALDIFDAVRGERRLAFSTIYRSLAALVDVRALRTIELSGVARYELVGPGGEHVHHVVCRVCQRTEVFHSAAMEAVIGQVAHRSPFVVESHDVVLHGLCPDCSAGRLDGPARPAADPPRSSRS